MKSFRIGKTGLILAIIVILSGIIGGMCISRALEIYNNISEHVDFFKVAVCEPESIDVIFSFDDSDTGRVKKAYGVFLKNDKALWVVSNDIPVHRLVPVGKADLPRIFQVWNMRNTFEEVLNLRYVLDDFRKKDRLLPSCKSSVSLVLVSDGWHLKRIQMIARALLPGYAVSFVAAEADETPRQLMDYYKEEFHDMFFDRLRCVLWKSSLGIITPLARRVPVRKKSINDTIRETDTYAE